MATPRAGRPARIFSRAADACSAVSKRYCRTRIRSGTVTGFWGTDRYRRGRVGAAHGVARGWSIPAYIGLATGTDYPDALAGGALAGHFGGVLLLTQPASLSPAAAQFIGEHRLLIDLVDVYGGPGAVHPQVMSEVEELLADG